MKTLKKWKWGYIALTIAVILLGVSLIIWPGISAEILCGLMGGILLVVGIVRILCYLQRGISALWHRYELPLGLMDAILGIYFLSRPANVILLLPVLVGFLIIVDSVFKIQTAMELKELKVSRWWSVMILAIVSILLAVFLIRNPFQGTVTLMIYVGITLVIDGIQGLLFIHQVAKNIRDLSPVDAEYIEIE